MHTLGWSGFLLRMLRLLLIVYVVAAAGLWLFATA
jgi:hypothetical protein